MLDIIDQWWAPMLVATVAVVAYSHFRLSRFNKIPYGFIFGVADAIAFGWKGTISMVIIMAITIVILVIHDNYKKRRVMTK